MKNKELNNSQTATGGKSAVILPVLFGFFVMGGEMKQALSGYLSVLFEQNPKAVGGAMPGDDFYYAE